MIELAIGLSVLGVVAMRRAFASAAGDGEAGEVVQDAAPPAADSHTQSIVRVLSDPSFAWATHGPQGVAAGCRPTPVEHV